MWRSIALALTVFSSRVASHPDISATCFGTVQIKVPIQYMFIQLSNNGENYTRSLGPLSYSLKGDGCVFSSEMVDREDGLYILRFHRMTYCENFEVSISINNTQLCDSPFVVENNVQDDCDCPQSMDKWLQHAQCDEEEQIKEDLDQYERINFTNNLSKSIQNWGREEMSRTYSFCHYQIISNKVYRKCYGEYTDFRIFVDEALLSILSISELPNTEFLFNLGDYPLSRKGFEDDVAIISWCGSTLTNDIVVPTYFFANYHMAKNFGSHSMHSIGLPRIPWIEKSPKVVFRGRDSNEIRIELAEKALHNELMDVGITTYFFFHETSNPPTKPRMNFNDFFKFRYVLSIDGTVAAYRLPLLLAGDSIILKSNSPYYEHWYSKLKAFKHFIPFEVENFEEIIESLKNLHHEKILEEMRTFYLNNLQSKNFYCYYIKLMKEYSVKLVDPPKVPSEKLELLEGSSRGFCKCKQTRRTEL
ncbi:unnamed protein product [Auanema sp. JU1783]|nr:unnamed protein product [Auanema sp. JU1783]